MRIAGVVVVGVVILQAAGAAQRLMPSHAADTPASRTGTQAAARVNGVAIGNDRVAAALAALIPQQSFHSNVPADRMAALRRQALDTVIDEELAYQEGVRAAVRVPPQDVDAAWSQTAARYGGAKPFGEALRRSGTTPASVRKELVRRLTIEQMYRRNVVDRCSVTRDEAAKFFREHPERFVEPEQLHVFALTINVDPSSGAARWKEAKATAELAKRELDAGASFAATVKKYSTDPSRDRGGDMGFLHRGSLTETFESAARTLPAGQPSGVIESLYGYHIILISDVRPPQKRTFDEVSKSLQQDLSSTRCDEMKTGWLAGLRASARIEVLEGQ